jgi:ABC-2 type transport system ATP-binding protein
MTATQQSPERERSMTAPQAPSGTPPLEANGIVKRYGPVEALGGVSFSVAAGEILCVCGPNGAGKTTLLEIVQGARLPDEGTISFLGEPVSAQRSSRGEAGVLFQDGGAPDRCSVRELLDVFESLFPDAMSTDEALAAVGMASKRDEKFHALSGGQRRRVLVATALIGNAPVLLLDEPTSGLDPQSREQIWTAITNAAEHGAAVLVTTHHLNEAEDYCDRVLLLSSGRVVAQGPARTVLDERDLRQCALIPASLADEARSLDSFEAARDSRIGAGRLAVFFADDEDLEAFTRDVRESLGGAVELQVRRSRLEDLLLLAGDEAFTSQNGGGVR